MKTLGIFNLIALLGLGALVLASSSAQGVDRICLAVFAGAGLVVIDVIGLIVLAGVALTRKQAKLTGQHRPQGTDEVTLASLTGQRRPQGTDEVTLASYLRNAQAQGIADGEVERKLLRNGWSGPEIQNARRILKAGADFD